MPCNISLDSPLLEQQSVREMLSFPVEENAPKASLEDLIKIAAILIKSELVDCGCDENELLSLRLQYEVRPSIDQETKEVYMLEWKPLHQVQALQVENVDTELIDESAEVEGNQEVLNQDLPVSFNFLRKASLRLDEAINNTLQGQLQTSSLSWRFNSSSPLKPGEQSDHCKNSHPNCIKEQGTQETIRKIEDGTFVRCGNYCESPNEHPID